MLSNKLTFSLASLIVLLMVGLCLPVAAQEIVSLAINAPTGENTSLEAGRDADGFAEGSFGLYAHADEPSAEGGTFGAPYLGLDGFAVTQRLGAADAGLPNLQEYFNDEFFTGTLELLYRRIATAEDAPGDTAFVRRQHDVVISEIMWALDDAEAQADLHLKQWIELVNTTADADENATLPSPGAEDIDMAGGEWVLHFTPNRHYVPRMMVAASEVMIVSGTPGAGLAYQVIDRVSTIYLSKWLMAGQNGRSRAGEQGDRFQTTDVTPLISAYRNINVTGDWDPRALLDGIEPSVFGKKAVPNGILAGAWVASTTRYNMAGAFRGTPGSLYIGPTVGITPTDKTSVAYNVSPTIGYVVINEIRSDDSDANLDWVELYNNGTVEVDLRGWELTHVQADPDPVTLPNTPGTDTDIMLVGFEAHGSTDADRFPENFKLQPGGYLLIVNRDPKDTPLAGGINIEDRNAGEDVNKGATHQYIVRPKLTFPGGSFTLILRDHVEKNWSHKDPRLPNDFHLASENIKDYAGNNFLNNYTVRPLTRIPHFNTRVWPFRGWDIPADSESIPTNKHQAWARVDYTDNDAHHKDTWLHVTGDGADARWGVGYDRDADLAFSPGTPGYSNVLIKDRSIDALGVSTFAGDISISEVMYDGGPRWNLIQWIEIYNSSLTEAINLKDWELEIRNATDDVESFVDSSVKFKDAIVLPNQTLLLVSGTGTNDVKPNRVYNLYEHHRRELGLSNRASLLLSPGGFYLRLAHPDPTQPNNPRAMVTIDEAGNVEVSGARREIVWALPPRDPGNRQSLVRQYGAREIDLDGVGDLADVGTMMESWLQSDIAGAGISFYGHRDDVGTPGFRLGGPLPVSLSSFRPARDKNTGEVVIRWITQSELNNAGFNILRSEMKNGAFKVVNLKGIIAGNGTTSEKHTYQWTDTTAKLNVVYYYQIEDVSLDGNRTILAMTHLRGNVTVAGKATTTWGDLKSQR